MSMKTRRKIPRHIITIGVGILFTAAGTAALIQSVPPPSWKRTHSIGNTRRGTYSYMVNGVTYTTPTSTGNQKPQQPNGPPRVIAYNPENPAESKPIQGISDVVPMYIFVMIGLGITYYGIRVERTKAKADSLRG
jgi:hypothetical protein